MPMNAYQAGGRKNMDYAGLITLLCFNETTYIVYSNLNHDFSFSSSQHSIRVEVPAPLKSVLTHSAFTLPNATITAPHNIKKHSSLIPGCVLLKNVNVSTTG
jgi:hypothetical protein